MKVINYTQTLLILLLLSCLLPFSAGAQVTIGSNLPASPLSLLDLKEKAADANNVNSTRGLGLPRVKLTDMDNLYPMFESTGTPGTPNTDYAASKSVIDAQHTGLVVYNSNSDICAGYIPGIFVWTGINWQPLSAASLIEPQVSTLAFSTSSPSTIVWRDATTPVLYIPSGQDLRTLSQQDLTLTWAPTSVGVTKGTLTSAAKGHVPFTAGGPSTAVWTFPAGTSPKTINFTATAMNKASLGITDSKPWYSFETRVPLTVPDPYNCGGSITLNLALNQTNFGLIVKPDQYGQFQPRVKNNILRYRYQISPIDITQQPGWDGNYFSFDIASNARWKSSYTEVTPKIIDDIGVAVKGGAELILGENPADYAYRNYYTPVRNTEGVPNRNRTAGILTFSDTAAIQRFYPVEVTMFQGTGDIDVSGIPDKGRLTSWPAGDGYGSNKVLKHEDQDGNIFLSAEFGGVRWMTTDLAAIHYDTESGIAAAKNPVPYDNALYNNFDGGKPKYAYPDMDLIGTVQQDLPPRNWGTKHSLWEPIADGVYYNWFAATGRFDYGTLGQDEKQVGAVGSSSPATSEVENKYPAGLQGICPNGWRLPTDRDWNVLEKFMYQNAGTYDIYENDDIAVINGTSWNSSWELILNNSNNALRGINAEQGYVGHGGSMKEVCSPNSVIGGWFFATKNYSKDHKAGGLNLRLGGSIGSINDYGNDHTPWGAAPDPNDKRQIQRERGTLGIYWTASNNGYDAAYTRFFNMDFANVQRIFTYKTALTSVRCVKK